MLIVSTVLIHQLLSMPLCFTVLMHFSLEPNCVLGPQFVYMHYSVRYTLLGVRGTGEPFAMKFSKLNLFHCDGLVQNLRTVDRFMKKLWRTGNIKRLRKIVIQLLLRYRISQSAVSTERS
ncbi:hypothetical protein Tcan_01145, partial [Toxocara canis]